MCTVPSARANAVSEGEREFTTSSPARVHVQPTDTTDDNPMDKSAKRSENSGVGDAELDGYPAQTVTTCVAMGAESPMQVEAMDTTEPTTEL